MKSRRGLFSFRALPQPLDPDANAPQKWREAPLYVPDPGLVNALELALSLRQPLLVTGEPGSGKTSAAYWAAWRMGLSPASLIHAQVRSDSSASSLKYQFDSINYFRAAQASALRNEPWNDDRGPYIQPGPLWRAFEAAAKQDTVVLLDEIDKAPRDLPNDLLHEFELLEFEVPEWPEGGRPRRIGVGSASARSRVLIVLTSNGERRLPNAFLRRCLHHSVVFDRAALRQIAEQRMRCGDLKPATGLIEPAITSFVRLRAVPGLGHRPGTAEFLVWLRILSLSGDMDPEALERVNLRDLPYLGALIKEPADQDAIRRSAG